MSLKDDFQDNADTYIEELQLMLQELPDKGLKCTDSQKVCLQICLNELEYCINGLEDEDFLETD